MRTPIYIGPAGWSYPDWAGSVYPPKKQRDFDPLEFISSYFNLIEINSTFYRVPAPEISRRWAQRVIGKPDFRFTLKAHRDFTHSKANPTSAAIDAFKSSIAPLLDADRLLCVLLQFPWSFKNTGANRRRIDQLVSSFRPFSVAVELRHGGWERDGGLEAVAQSGATVCAVDQPVIGDSIPFRDRGTGGQSAYFRLHGRNKSEWFKPDTNRDLRYNYLYSRSELTPVADTIRGASKTAKEVVVVLNNHFRGQAVANSIELKSMLSGAKVPIPARMLNAYPRLRSIALPDPNAEAAQGELFDSDSTAEDN
ncbi:MAG: DUF72 domain-containing protein [Candidatus Krumholzibacteria bacterium]|nr:DUF72 domain-containing protein [Candidatus Krumholzibacteria bacterium]